MKYQNVVVPVANYATSALQETLTRWGEKGYRFVNVCVGCELIVIKNEMLRKQGAEQFADPSFGVHVFADRLKDVAKINGSVSADDIEQLLKDWDKLAEGRYKRK